MCYSSIYIYVSRATQPIICNTVKKSTGNIECHVESKFCMFLDNLTFKVKKSGPADYFIGRAQHIHPRADFKIAEAVM